LESFVLNVPQVISYC